MKNVQCRKLIIDQTKAPNKVGTLKDISLYGSFQLSSDDGLIARSLAGTGKELKKTKAQLKALANRPHPIAAATGATTTNDAHYTSAERRDISGESYSIRFIQLLTEPVTPPTVQPVQEGHTRHIDKAGHALKTGGAKRVQFTLEQKELMIEFYDRQANEGIRADPAACIAAMRERGLSVLKENQIRSWWSSYHEKRRRENQRLAVQIQQLQGQPASSVLSAAGVTEHTVHGANLTSSTSTATPNTPSTSATTPNTPSTSRATQNTIIPQPAISVASHNTAFGVSPVPSVEPTLAVHTDHMGTNVGDGVTEWYSPFGLAQSTIDNRNGSDACVFIAFNFGLLYQRYNLDNTLVGLFLNLPLELAMRSMMNSLIMKEYM